MDDSGWSRFESMARQSAVFGCWCTLGDAFSVELVGALGYDYVCIDGQHGLVGYEAMLGMLQAARASRSLALVRVASNSTAAIGQALDAGAEGVVVPMVGSADQAASAVAACRYPPAGLRSLGPLRAEVVRGSRDQTVLEQVGCLVMVETAEGLRNAEEIARTRGLDGIYIGPADLAVGLGMVPGESDGIREFEEALTSIRSACRRAGILCGIHCASGDAARRRAAEGFQIVTVASTPNAM